MALIPTDWRPATRPPALPRRSRIGTLLTPALLAELDALYPERAPDPRAPEIDKIIACAHRDLIRRLHAEFAAANTSDPSQRLLP